MALTPGEHDDAEVVTHLVLHVEQIYPATWLDYEAINDTHTITDDIFGVDNMELWVNYII